MKLGYISDLHIDINDRYDIINYLIVAAKKNKIDALAIAGDISNEIALTKLAIARLERELGITVFYINGNHEFYEQPYSEEFHSESAQFITPNTVLLTTTGWYDYTWDSIGRVEQLKKGKTEFGRWSDHRWIDWETSKTLRIGQDPAMWYNDQCISRLVEKWEDYKKVPNKVLMMHMLPHKNLLAIDPGYYSTNPFFGSESMCKTIFGIVKPNTIIYGHTHFTNDQIINNTYCTCRPFGYANYEWTNPEERMNKTFDVMEIG